MPFSHHSHSGQFCPGHARNTLEEMVQTAISKKMRVFALTEHMPRHDVDQYPEEIDMGCDLEWHYANELAYYAEANRLRRKYEGQITIMVGFECDWIRPESKTLIERSIDQNACDFFVGSVHHVHTIPIDYDTAMYLSAAAKAGGTDAALFADYFDAQLDMLKALKPPVIGHFDLIRLKSDQPEVGFQSMPAVWTRILRNLEFIASYGGIIEINFASLRKGMAEPYPKREICQIFRQLGGRFCMSDDSHGTDQIGLNYHRAPQFLREAGITSLCYLTTVQDLADPFDSRFPSTQICQVDVAHLLQDEFWSL